MASFLLQQSHLLWKIRCETVQVENNQTAESLLRKKLHDQCQQLKKNNWKIKAIHRYLLNKKENYFEVTSKTNLYIWQSRIKEALEHQKEVETSAGNDIRKWLHIFRKPKTNVHRKFVRLKGRRRLCKFVSPLL